MTDLFDIDWGFGTPETPALAEPPEAQSEPKRRKTRSHLKAKVYETSDKFEYRRAFSEVQLLDALGGRFEFKPGTAYHFLTAGNIDSLSFLKAVLRQQSVRHLVVSTWCMGADDILWFREQVETGRIEKMDLYLGEIFSGSYRTEFSMVKDLYTENTVVTIDEGLYRFHKDYFDGIVSIEK